MRRTTILVAIAIAVSSASIGGQQTERTPRTIPTDAERANIEFKRRERAVRDAMRGLFEGTLTMPQAVAMAGGRLPMNEAPNPDDLQEPDLQNLARKSRVVVVARPVTTPTVHLSEDGRRVMSRYVLQVEEKVRGERDAASNANSRIAVDIPGGVLNLSEGTVEAVSGVELKIGQPYVLFLQKPEDALDAEGRAKLAERRAAAGRAAGEVPFIVTGQHYEGLFLVEGANVRSLVAKTFVEFKDKQDRRALRSLLDEARSAR